MGRWTRDSRWTSVTTTTSRRRTTSVSNKLGVRVWGCSWPIRLIISAHCGSSATKTPWEIQTPSKMPETIARSKPRSPISRGSRQDPCRGKGIRDDRAGAAGSRAEFCRGVHCRLPAGHPPRGGGGGVVHDPVRVRRRRPRAAVPDARSRDGARRARVLHPGRGVGTVRRAGPARWAHARRGSRPHPR